MLIGVPREIKDNEFRVGLTPASVAELMHHGHQVLVEGSAGIGSGLADAEYVAAGATIVEAPREIFARAEMIVKVKEPLAEERKLLRRGQILFTYLHLAPDLAQTMDLIASGATCIAYETVTSPYGGLPLLTPMSEVAGRLAPQVGRACAGEGAGRTRHSARRRARRAGGRGDRSRRRRFRNPRRDDRARHGRERHRRRQVERGAAPPFRTVRHRRSHHLFDARDDRRLVKRADLLIGAVLVPGAAAPKLVTRAMLSTMKPGAVIVDVAIDQGGCCETSNATTHSRPDLCRRRRRALLRRQHARRGRAHLDLRAQQRDAALRARDRRQGLASVQRGVPVANQSLQSLFRVIEHTLQLQSV